MDYQQTIDYLFTRLPMYSRIGAAAYKNDLTNTIRLCSYLGDPQKRFKSIHVAGTNGKGSVSHMLAAILQTAGYKTGLHTSPHLKDFRERIKINGEMIDPVFVMDFTEKIAPLIEEIEPSFFEITVAMAFDYFAREQVDVAVIEVGLGGRLDSTNIIRPELSIITNIGWDHMNMLGDSLEKIAYEKAGIIKTGIPVVVGELLPETEPVFYQVAKEKNAPINIASQKRQVTDWKWEKQELIVEISEQHQTDHQKYHLDLPGIYQTKNLVTLLEACSQLQQKDWPITQEMIHTALKQVKKMTGLHGRWEIIHHAPLLVLDVAHNVDGVRLLVQQLELMEPRHLHIIIGLVKDKEAEKIMQLLPKNATYYFTKAQIPRALPEDELAAIAAMADLQGSSFPEVNDAVKAALSKADPADLILVCGSVFLVGEVR
jgi:dihydrofolate synthase / folylpolyglutamate synthase